MILEGARLALVGVTDDVLRLRRVLQHELPLHPGREAGAAAAFQAGGFHQLDDVVRLHREGFAQTLVSFVLQIEIERVGAGLADVSGEYWIHGSRYPDLDSDDDSP